MRQNILNIILIHFRIFINLIPVFGAALAMTFLGERLFTYHLLGAALVFSGIFLSVRR